MRSCACVFADMSIRPCTEILRPIVTPDRESDKLQLTYTFRTIVKAQSVLLASALGRGLPFRVGLAKPTFADSNFSGSAFRKHLEPRHPANSGRSLIALPSEVNASTDAGNRR